MPRRVAQSHDDYSPEEAQQRFIASLKAAVNTPPKPLKSMTPKGAKKQSKKRPKSRLTK
jgi:hypothetical protein